jgi:hypothetical protein
MRGARPTPVAGDVGPTTQQASVSLRPHAPEPFRSAHHLWMPGAVVNKRRSGGSMSALRRFSPQLAIPLVPLPPRRLRLGVLLPVLPQRPSYVILLLKPPVVVSSNVPLVALMRLDKLALPRHVSSAG